MTPQLPTSPDAHVIAQFTPENAFYGFAVWQLLNPYLERGCVRNQATHSLHDPQNPQFVDVEFDIDRGDLPPDLFQYEVLVQLDPTRSFYEQDSRLVVTSGESYPMPLGNLMQLLPRLKRYGAEILPCLRAAT